MKHLSGVLCTSLFCLALVAQDAPRAPQFVAEPLAATAAGPVVASAGATPVIIQVTPAPAPASATAAAAATPPATAWYAQLTSNPMVITAFLTACVTSSGFQDQSRNSMRSAGRA